MHAYLVVGKDKKKVEEKGEELVLGFGAKRLDFSFASIEEARNLISFLSLKVDGPTAIVIADFNKVSEEASNAFLKSLEEGGENLFFVLMAKGEEGILPTIKSRCLIVRVDRAKSVAGADEEASGEFLEGSLSLQIRLISNVKGRLEAASFLENIFFGVAKRIREGERKSVFADKKYAKMGALAFLAVKKIEANSNVFLTLLSFVVALDTDPKLGNTKVNVQI